MPIKKSLSNWLNRNRVHCFALILPIVFFFQIYTADAQSCIRKINITGANKTREYVVLRELLFKTGDTIQDEDIERLKRNSGNNLLNTSLFNFVEINFTKDSLTDSYDVNISLTERWYIWPVPVFELADRNFNSWYQTADFTRINFGLNTQWRNVTGNWDELDLITQFGKNRILALDYTFPYLNHAKTLGAGIMVSESGKREIVTEISNDKQVRSFSEINLEHSLGINARLTYRQNYYVSHLVSIGYENTRFNNSLLNIDTISNEFKLSNSSSLTAYYKVKFDHRDIKYYPLEGWYADAEINSAIPLNQNTKHFVWIKSTNRFYKPLRKCFFWGINLTLKHTLGNEPFHLRQCLGYGRDYVRGYEYYVVDGKGFALIKTNLKFALVPARNFSVSFIPWYKFSKIHFASYLNIFADAAKTWSDIENSGQQNILPSQVLLGYGAGIDLVTYYDLVLRIEFSVNRMNEKGIFFHMISGI